MGFPPSFLEELRVHAPLVEIVGRRVKLTRRGREHTGLCPFHNEKTPSFTVSDEKGFYHCFGCGAHGDVIKFVQETEGLSFPETVERLAMEAGLSLPERTPVDREKEARRATLIDANEATASWFREQLKSSRGGEAQAYLKKRGLTETAIGKFGLGYAPPGRQLLKQALMAKGFEEALLIEAGLLIKPEEDGESFDRFRNRLMFPIRDRRGRVVAFGGRAMDKDAHAKYLNSPETSLFHKGAQLYNLDLAQGPARERAAIIVAEGYMDVIALADGGFPHAVAPLGTALTEDQLKLLWRIAPEPILCFDGDNAGIRAAWRAAERALPLLEPGRSLRFAILPQGQDPDDLIRGEGPKAMQTILEAATPLADLIWEKMTGQADLSTPERRAGLSGEVMALIRQIGHVQLRGFYEQEFKSRLGALFGANRAARPAYPGRSGFRPAGRQWGAKPAPASSFLKATAAARPAAKGPQTRHLERVILMTVINHPGLLMHHLEELGGAHFSTADIDKAIRCLISLAASGEDLDSTRARNTLRDWGLDRLIEDLTRDPAFRRHSFAAEDVEEARAEAGLSHCLARLRRVVDLERERADAEAELAETASQAAYERLQAIYAALNDSAGMEIDIDLAKPALK